VERESAYSPAQRQRPRPLPCIHMQLPAARLASRSILALPDLGCSYPHMFNGEYSAACHNKPCPSQRFGPAFVRPSSLTLIFKVSSNHQ
jgi:hypothetical protein